MNRIENRGSQTTLVHVKFTYYTAKLGLITVQIEIQNLRAWAYCDAIADKVILCLPNVSSFVHPNCELSPICNDKPLADVKFDVMDQKWTFDIFLGNPLIICDNGQIWTEKLDDLT